MISQGFLICVSALTCCWWIRVCGREISLMLKLNEQADRQRWRIMQTERSQPCGQSSLHQHSWIYNTRIISCVRMSVCLSSASCRFHSVIHTHLSTFMSYFTRLFPVSAQVSSLCISSLLFSLICTSHTLITINVLDCFTLCRVCVSLSHAVCFDLTLPFL